MPADHEAIKNSCPNCGTNIPLDITRGLCPKCLLGAGLLAPSNADQPTIAPSSTSIRTASDVEEQPTFGDYVLIHEIARGGMGVVYKAKHTQLNRTVALKMILSGRFASENDVLRFRQEAEAAANLDHPGIVPIYEIGEIDGNNFFSMKLIEGGSLAERLSDLREDTRDIVSLVAEVSKAVHHAHQRGILHRDLKPANILLDEKGMPLVTDLGLAKQIESDSGMTHTGAIVGTPAYMAPEQAAGDKDITTSADIYSLGAILYEALTGQPPHVGSSPMETLLKVMNDVPSRPRELDRKISGTLELICLKCLKRDPMERYSSAGALADDLECWLDARPVSVRGRSLTAYAGEVFRTNLRSAVGAAAIGVITGILLAGGFFSFTFAQVVGHGRQVDVRALYKSFSADAVPNLWFADLPSWIAWPGVMLTIIVVVFTGLVIHMTVRPENGQQSIAIGLVAGLMQMLAVFSLFVGFLATSSILMKSEMNSDVELLSQASFAQGEARVVAHQEYLRRYPELRKVEESKRPELISGKVLSDATLVIPRGIFFGLLASAVMCLIPCVGCTIAAQRLYVKQKTFGKVLLPYSEVAFFLLVLVFLLCGWELLHYLNMKVTNRPNILVRCVVYCIPIALMLPGFKGWTWRWRYAFYGCVLAVFWFVQSIAGS